MKNIFRQMRHWNLLLFILMVPQALFALAVPAQKGYVNDTAEMLTPHTRRYLSNVLANLERESSHQVMVLTLASLQGENLEAYSIKVAQQWGIGQKEADNGALLFIARKERKIRIEVGYGLEGTLTDLKAGRIIRSIIAPNFKKRAIRPGGG